MPKIIIDSYTRVAVDRGSIAATEDSSSSREASFDDRWDVCSSLTRQGWARASEVAAEERCAPSRRRCNSLHQQRLSELPFFCEIPTRSGRKFGEAGDPATSYFVQDPRGAVSPLNFR